MRLVVGLGNPGSEYKNNRHNAGFMVIDRLAGEAEWDTKFEALILKTADYLLAKPQTFMNRSGEAVAKLTNFYKVASNDLWIIHDDLDIRLGRYKIQMAIGPKVHKGLSSIEECLGTTNFWRVRVGIDNRPARESRAAGEEYVLADFTVAERELLDEVIERIVGDLTQ